MAKRFKPCVNRMEADETGVFFFGVIKQVSRREYRLPTYCNDTIAVLKIVIQAGIFIGKRNSRVLNAQSLRLEY